MAPAPPGLSETEDIPVAKRLGRGREDLPRALPRLAKEGFERVYVLSSSEEADAAVIVGER